MGEQGVPALIEPPRPSRRALIGGALALGGGALLSACGGSGAAATTATPALKATSTGSTATTSRAVATSAPGARSATTSGVAGRAAVQLRYWGLSGPQEPGPTDRQLISEFNQAHPQLRVELDNKPQIGTVTADALTAAIAAGVGPDVVYLGIALIQDFAAAAALAPLDQYVSAKGFNLDDFYPQFLAPPRWHGKLFGLPYVPDDRGMFWNKDLFRAAGLPPDVPPKTWGDLQRMSAALTKNSSGSTATQLGFVPGWGNPVTYAAWYLNLFQLGGNLLTPDRRTVAYNTPLGIQALQTIVDQLKVVGGYQVTQAFAQANKPPSGLDLFSAGHLGLYYTIVARLKTYDKISSLDYGVGPFALPPGGHHANLSGCPYLSVTQGSRHHDDAWQLIAYLVSPDPLRRFNVADTTLPPRKSVATSAAFLQTNSRLKYFVDELADTHLYMYIPGSVDIFKVHGQMYTDAITGKVTATDAIANSVPQVQAILDRNAAAI